VACAARDEQKAAPACVTWQDAEVKAPSLLDLARSDYARLGSVPTSRSSSENAAPSVPLQRAAARRGLTPWPFSASTALVRASPRRALARGPFFFLSPCPSQTVQGGAARGPAARKAAHVPVAHLWPRCYAFLEPFERSGLSAPCSEGLPIIYRPSNSTRLAEMRAKAERAHRFASAQDEACPASEPHLRAVSLQRSKPETSADDDARAEKSEEGSSSRAVLEARRGRADKATFSSRVEQAVHRSCSSAQS